MDHQRRWLGQFGDAVDRRLQCRVGVGVRLLVEPDMAVADLHKREAAALGRYCLAAELQALRHAADYCPHEAGAGPSHALQHPPPVRIYIAFFGHSSLLVAIGVWVMSAICRLLSHSTAFGGGLIKAGIGASLPNHLIRSV